MKLVKMIMMLTVFVGTNPIAGGGKGKIANFHVKYDIKFDSDAPEMAQAMPMLAGSSMTVTKDDNYNQTVFKTGSMMTVTTTLDNESKKGIAVTEGMMGNFYTKIDGAEDKDTPEVDVKKTSTTKKILGYTCTKYVVSTEEGDMEIWTTTELEGEYDSKFTPKSGKIEGFPLMMVIETEQMTITMTASKYNDAIPSGTKLSVKPPKDYEEKSAEDMKKMGGM